jgi:hypothetical protein
MKKKLLILMLTTLGTFQAFAQFTAGNLAVYRYGEGTAMTNGQRVAVFVDEYTPSGTFVKTIAIPRTVNGGNYGFEGLGLKADGTYEGEGYPVLSRDGSTLSIIGYNPDQAGEFVIGTLNAAGIWSANTLVAAADAIGTPRSAVVEGTAVYFNGFQNGVRYKLLGTNTSSTRVSDQQNAPRVLTIAQTSYGAGPTVATKIFAPIGSTSVPSINLPTTLSTFTAVPNIPGGAPLVNAHQALVFKSSSGRTLMYVLDDNAGSPLLKKYRSNAGGTDWVEFGNIAVPLNTKSIAGTYSSTSGVQLYYTTYANPGSANASQLYTYMNSFTTATEADNSARLTGTGTLVATAPANTTFRGVTMAPGSSILPVKLTAFNANEKNGAIRLNWSTASESNSSHYNILRSSTANKFAKIAEVKATGIASNYAYVDENPLPGTNYYQLQQVDLDGQNELFGPVSANIPVPQTDFKVVAIATSAVVELHIYAAKKQNVQIELANINGAVKEKSAIALEKGYQKVILSAEKLVKGVNIAILNTPEGRQVKKFVW